MKRADVVDRLKEVVARRCPQHSSPAGWREHESLGASCVPDRCCEPKIGAHRATERATFHGVLGAVLESRASATGGNAASSMSPSSSPRRTNTVPRVYHSMGRVGARWIA